MLREQSRRRCRRPVVVLPQDTQLGSRRKTLQNSEGRSRTATQVERIPPDHLEQAMVVFLQAPRPRSTPADGLEASHWKGGARIHLSLGRDVVVADHFLNTRIGASQGFRDFRNHAELCVRENLPGDGRPAVLVGGDDNLLIAEDASQAFACPAVGRLLVEEAEVRDLYPDRMLIQADKPLPFGRPGVEGGSGERHCLDDPAIAIHEKIRRVTPPPPRLH
ncbi:MAG: hypothetical protein JWR00_2184 [Rubritepida sp.]|nr:hypothetical protein [Rubritepida sp.]